MKQCVVCNNLYVSTGNYSKYCAQCRKTKYLERISRWHQKHREAHNAAMRKKYASDNGYELFMANHYKKMQTS